MGAWLWGQSSTSYYPLPCCQYAKGTSSHLTKNVLVGHGVNANTQEAGAGVALNLKAMQWNPTLKKCSHSFPKDPGSCFIISYCHLLEKMAQKQCAQGTKLVFPHKGPTHGSNYKPRALNSPLLLWNIVGLLRTLLLWLTAKVFSLGVQVLLLVKYSTKNALQLHFNWDWHGSECQWPVLCRQTWKQFE